MRIDEYLDREVLVFVLSGRLDGSSSSLAEEKILYRVPDERAVVIDLKNVDYISSAGLRVILKAAKLARSNGTELGFASISPHVQQVFDISGFTTILTIFETVAGAIAEVAGRNADIL